MAGAEPEAEAEGAYAESESEAEAEAEGELAVEPEAEGGKGKGSFTPRGEFHAMDCVDMVIGTAKGNTYRIFDYYTRDR